MCGTAQPPWSSPTRAWRARWRAWRSTPRSGRGAAAAARHGGARPSSRRTPSARARRLLAASEAAWEAGAGDAAHRPPTRLWRRARTRCCTPTSFVFARASTRSRAGVAEDVSAALCGRRRTPSLHSTRCGRRTCLPTRSPRSGRHGTPSRTSTLARAARDMAGESGDPLFDYVLGWELARQGSIDEAMPAPGSGRARDPRHPDPAR